LVSRRGRALGLAALGAHVVKLFQRPRLDLGALARALAAFLGGQVLFLFQQGALGLIFARLE